MRPTVSQTYIDQISAKNGPKNGEDVILRGWLTHKRSSGKLYFIEMRDGTGVIQCVVFKNDVSPGVFALCEGLSLETSIEVTGTVREDKRSAIGFEVGVKNLKQIGASPDYPISNKEHGTGFLMDHRHLWLRSSRQVAIMKVRSTLIKAIRDFFDGRGFTLIDSPIFTPNACEGTTTLFETEYFGQKAYLTQSGQLYAEAGALAHGKAYCFGPTFRAEKSKTRRHLTEFWMVEPEVAFMELDGDMQLAEDFVVFIVQRVLETRRKELQYLERDIAALEKVLPPFPRLSYSEAVERLQALGRDFKWGGDFGAEDETVLSQQFDRPILVHRYPREVKAFYMKTDPQNDQVALCVDMLAPEGYGEIIGGGQREDSLEVLESKIRAHGLPLEAFSWYLDLRRYGSVPHAGFGMGVERALAWICGLPHVRETIPFPRMLERLTP